MTYSPPTIGIPGLAIPTYTDLEDYLVSNARSIFGADIYLGNDSQDFQDIAGRSKIAYDFAQGLLMVYDARSPVTATGTGLDAIVAINGLQRRPASSSVVTVNITGTAFTVITNGIVADTNGNFWNLPLEVILDDYGTASVTATAQTAGAVSALPGQISIIQTPTIGWTSVTNPNAATPGRNVETDSELRARQIQSVANPSQALVPGILGGVLAVESVVAGAIYENDTNNTINTINGVFNPDGYPPHSITVVVSGGDGEEIAEAMAVRKTPGCYTNGDQVYDITDQYGTVTPIRFFLADQQTITVEVTIEALGGYSSAIGDAGKEAIVTYINSLSIGQNVLISELWQAFLNADTSIRPSFSLTTVEAAISPASPATSDLVINFNKQAITTIDDITLTVT